MKLIDPTVKVMQQDNQRAPVLNNLEGLTIGLLSNAKLNADLLLQETALRLQQRFGGKVLPLRYKRNPSAPAPAEILTNLSPECDYLITAAGD